MKIIGLSVGIVGTPSEVYDAVVLRNTADIDLQRMTAVSIIQAVSLLSSGGDPMERMAHLYPPKELEELQKKMKERERKEQEEKAQRTLLLQLKRYATVKKLGYDDYRRIK